AQNGSGKTGVFVVGVLQTLDVSLTRPQALVVVPTMELGLQIASEFEKLGKHMEGLKVTVAIKGTKENKKLAGHIIIATPGKFENLMKKKCINTKHLKYLIIDEADDMALRHTAEMRTAAA
ncbi:DBP5, partial [Symbiodinium sp. KB8]